MSKCLWIRKPHAQARGECLLPYRVTFSSRCLERFQRFLEMSEFWIICSFHALNVSVAIPVAISGQRNEICRRALAEGSFEFIRRKVSAVGLSASQNRDVLALPHMPREDHFVNALPVNSFVKFSLEPHPTEENPPEDAKKASHETREY